jgi:hypothetical protein
MIFLNYQMVWKKIATDTLEISKVQQIRLLGRETVVLDGITYPLSTQVQSSQA